MADEGYVVETTPGREYILKMAMDTDVSDVLHDILQCSVKNVVREISSKDIDFLSEYMDFKQKKGGEIDAAYAKRQIEKLLMDYPAFRTPNSDQLVLNIATFFANNGHLAKHSPPRPAYVKNSPPSPKKKKQAAYQPNIPPLQDYREAENPDQFFGNTDPYQPP